ncbi:MAG TPA: hypothetical protein VI750_04690 [Pyrinomonadaceae bacterium]|nr:hypothetical protein [Pyrinomonadaceae bacterium]
MVEVSKTSRSDKIIIEAFAKLDKTALGLAVGTLCGLAVFTATVFLLLKGGDVVGPNLALLGQFFVGYTVTVKGAFIGLVYGFVGGFILGWLIGFFRNSLLSAYILALKTRANLTSSLDSID